MDYRTVTFNWLPRAKTQWQTYTDTRKEAAHLWNDLVMRHARIRRLNWTWPTKGRWEQWGKRRYPNLHSQSVQQIIGEFCEAVNATRQLRKNGHTEASYPFRLSRYHDVVYTNQAAHMVEGDGHRLLVLPNGKAGRLKVRVPDHVKLPGRLMEIRLSYGKLSLVCELPDKPTFAQTTIGVDLGVNTLLCATDGQVAVVISGREAKASVQWRNKRLASLVSKQSQHERGSRRYKRLQKRKYKLLDKASNRIHDLIHKSTRKVKDAFPQAQVYVGKPFNEAARKIGRVWAQQVSSASNAKLIAQLDYKTAGAIQVSEAYSSQTCPVCGERRKCRRTYVCKHCGYTAPRDVVGAVNILRMGQQGSLQNSAVVPTRIVYIHPTKVSRSYPSSSGGHPASSSDGVSPTRIPHL
ncbi:MAG: transposase [Burkholderiales bacterium]|nr:transposase [Anaerolineae bacterium]